MNWKTVLKLAVTLALLSFLAYRLDADKLWETLSSMQIRFLLLAALMQGLLVLVSVLRWRILLRSFSMRKPYLHLLRITFVGNFFSLFLPSSIGGDFFRAYYVSKATAKNLSQALVTTLLDRAAGLFSLLLIGLVAALRRPLQVQGLELLYVFVVLLIAFAAVNLAMFHPGTHRLVDHTLERLGLTRFEERLGLIYRGLRSLSGSPGSIARVVSLSLVIQIMSVVIVWLLAQGLGVVAPFGTYLVFVPLINLSIMVPLTINGFGLREYLYTLLFSELGVADETAFALGLLSALTLMLAALPGGILYSLSKMDVQPEGDVVEPS